MAKFPIQKQETQARCEPLPKLSETPIAERSELFRRKLELCSVVFNFHSCSHQREKEEKKQTLLEIADYIAHARDCFNEALFRDSVRMVEANIFRALPARSKDLLAPWETEFDEPFLEQAWPHLQVVYEFLFRLIISNFVDLRITKRYIDQMFVLKLLELFDSEDPREREYLKMILHRIYGKFMVMRAFLRRSLQHHLFGVIYECEARNGVAELLVVLGSIINGFALPLKEEHKDFLIKALLPLYKARSLASYHQPLSYCMAQYVSKDRALAYDIMSSMLRYWPVCSASKQVIFLEELEEMLELTCPFDFCRIQHALFRRLALCIGSPHFQVAERALMFWKSDYIVMLISQNPQEILPLIVAALHRNSKHHWHRMVRSFSGDVLKLLAEMDEQRVSEYIAKDRADELKAQRENQERAQRWGALQDMFDAGRRTGATKSVAFAAIQRDAESSALSSNALRPT